MLLNYNKLIKSICYRIVSSTITVLISFFITGNFKVGLSIGLIDLVFKITNYYYFDLIWEKIFHKKVSPSVIWLTGLSGSGKSTIAEEMIKKFEKYNIKYVLLDGDQIRKVIKESGFDYASRKKHNLNVAYIASLFESQGNVVIVSLVSPFKEVRDECRKLCKNFIEVFVDTSLEICEQRDVKGLYKKARTGEIKDFTGISSPYENPINPEIHIKTSDSSAEESAKYIINFLCKK